METIAAVAVPAAPAAQPDEQPEAPPTPLVQKTASVDLPKPPPKETLQNEVIGSPI